MAYSVKCSNSNVLNFKILVLVQCHTYHHVVEFGFEKFLSSFRTQSYADLKFSVIPVFVYYQLSSLVACDSFFDFSFHFKIIYPGYNSVYIPFYNWPCKSYLQNKEFYDTKFTIKI